MPPTLHAAAELIRQGRTTPAELLEECLARIDRYETHVRAWVFVDRENARADAARLTDELRKGHSRGPLHGIPVGIKDIFDVFDWPTAAGSKLWSQSIARRDATVVERLRHAGVVMIGKTVTTQYASFDPPVTRNPWDQRRTPGGSSSGSAAAVACGMCLGALGSQTGGSITRPASYCGAAGFKPTFGRVSIDGVMPLAPSLDHVGPIAPCVRDLALILQVIGGPDPRDPSCSERPLPDLLHGITPTAGPRRPRLGRVRGYFEEFAEPSMRSMMDAAAESFRAAGAAITEVALPGQFADVMKQHRNIMAVESAAYHQIRLQRHPEDYDPWIRALLEEGLACPAPDYARAREYQRQLAREIQACFQGVDALLMPATTGPAPDAATTGNPAFNSPWSLTGLPTVSFPTGRFADGLPLAIQVVGPAWSEAELLATAAWCEAALGAEHKDPPLANPG